MKSIFLYLRHPSKLYSPELWIILLALLLRVLWVVAVPVVPISDSHAYDTLARNLASGIGYRWSSYAPPTAFWPVGTSLIYSLLYRVFGFTYLPIVIFNLLLSAIIIFCSMRLAQTWFNRSVAIATGLLLALWPIQIQFTTVLASELPFIALVLVALLLWINDRTNLWLRAILVGILSATATYVRPIAYLIPLLLLFFRWVKTRELFKSLKATAIIFVLMAVLLAPWSIRNTMAFGQFVTISTNGGANLWMGNNPNSTGGFMKLPAEVYGMNEAERDKYLKSVALAHIKEKPLLFVWRCVTRLVDTHSRESIGISWNESGLKKRYGTGILLPLKIINQIFWMSVLGLALSGIVILGLQQGLLTTITHPTVVIWGYFVAIHAIIVAQDRYHFPSIPMIAILAAFTLTYWIDKKRKVQKFIKNSRTTL
ncbi:MAG TPA: glycosyl transferase family 39 [Cyanobacteria bacterium UBA11372]|nr:glycosyl transferase family 39 [Cyanobacteria bacterium UBA11372]